MNSKYERNKILYCTPADEDTPQVDMPDGCYFSQETINSIITLGDILRKIHNRLIKEGYSIIDGRLIGPDGSIKYEPKRNKQQEYTQRN